MQIILYHICIYTCTSICSIDVCHDYDLKKLTIYFWKTIYIYILDLLQAGTCTFISYISTTLAFVILNIKIKVVVIKAC